MSTASRSWQRRQVLVTISPSWPRTQRCPSTAHRTLRAICRDYYSGGLIGSSPPPDLHAHHVRGIRVSADEVPTPQALAHGLALTPEPVPPMPLDRADKSFGLHALSVHPESEGVHPCSGNDGVRTMGRDPRLRHQTPMASMQPRPTNATGDGRSGRLPSGPTPAAALGSVGPRIGSRSRRQPPP